jgi:hypothetical protein
MRLILPVFSVLILAALTLPAYAQQSNFTISPPPIAWPYFDEGRSDLSVSGSYVNINADSLSMTGGVASVKGRQALSSALAVSVAASFGGLGGKMPGIPPMSVIYTSGSYSYVPYFTQPTGRATVSFLSMNGSFNLELQPVHTESFDIIIFGGVSYNYSSMSITSPFALIVPPPYSNAGTYYYGYQDTLTLTLTQYGYQFGTQIDLALSPGLRISPFFMMSAMQGNATMIDKTNASGSRGTSFSAKIPKTTSYSLGLDIIIQNVSIGSMLQQMQKASETNRDTSVLILSATYHFEEDREAK